ncbi:MAG: ATP synthase F1 subunit gamma [Fimbriimonadaceae bacterium]|nr:ATP synthase F1 subunit gamma [Fimbriimonadaceae bacterium]
MANLKQIRQRIRTSKNIRQITRAMKLVAAARLKKAQDRVTEARPYSDKMRELMLSLSEAGDLPSHPLLEKQEGDKTCMVLITADRGLAGSYNTNLIRKTSDFLKEHTGIHLYCVGKKGYQFFNRRGVKLTGQYSVPSTGARVEDAQEVTRVVSDLFTSGEYDRILICYSKFYSPIRQVPQIVQVLPIEPPTAEQPAEKRTKKDYTFEPDSTTLLATLLPKYLLNIMFQAMLESTASEHGSRMTAMSSATDNAGKMIDDLTLKANRERQSKITTEILEVVGGAEALNN